MKKTLNKDLFLDGIELPHYPEGTEVKVLEIKLNTGFASGKAVRVEFPDGRVEKICDSFITRPTKVM